MNLGASDSTPGSVTRFTTHGSGGSRLDRPRSAAEGSGGRSYAFGWLHR
jgi:hypothetical protein